MCKQELKMFYRIIGIIIAFIGIVFSFRRGFLFTIHSHQEVFIFAFVGILYSFNVWTIYNTTGYDLNFINLFNEINLTIMNLIRELLFLQAINKSVLIIYISLMLFHRKIFLYRHYIKYNHRITKKLLLNRSVYKYNSYFNYYIPFCNFIKNH